MTKSTALFSRAQEVIPGGVNSPVRAFKGVGGTPVFIQKAKGAYIYDTEGKQYIDYVGSWGPMILGHNHPAILDAVLKAAENGLSFGAPTPAEIDLAELVCEIVPSIEMVRMVSSGTEATMTAIRLARGYTNRSKILKFEGCYHGHADCLLVKAGSGISTLCPPAFGQEEKGCYCLFDCFCCFMDGKHISCSVYGTDRDNYNIVAGSIWNTMASERHDGLLSSLDYKG